MDAFFNKDHDLSEKYNTICDIVSADVKKNLITILSTVKNILKQK